MFKYKKKINNAFNNNNINCEKIAIIGIFCIIIIIMDHYILFFISVHLK